LISDFLVGMGLGAGAGVVSAYAWREIKRLRNVVSWQGGQIVALSKTINERDEEICKMRFCRFYGGDPDKEMDPTPGAGYYIGYSPKLNQRILSWRT